MQLYGQTLSKVFNKEIDWDSDALTATLHTAAYTPNRDTHAYVSDLTNEVAAGGGYTSGGIVLTSVTRTFTAANSWSSARANSTAYAVGDVVRPASGNGFLYRAAVAGTSAGSPPSFGTTVGRETPDGTVVWECVGTGVIVLGAANLAWAAPFTASFRYLVLSDRTAGSANAQPLIGYSDYGPQTGTGSGLNIAFSTQGILHVFVT